MEIEKTVSFAPEVTPTPEQVKKINALATELVAGISKKDQK
jgi:hypothetical protein